MKALSFSAYGRASDLRLVDVPEPEPGPFEVKLRVRAVSMNGSDLEFLHGSPGHVRFFGPFRPPFSVLGSDVAGEIVQVGSRVTRFRVGDRAFGDLLLRFGGLAEYLTTPEDRLKAIPDGLDYIRASTLPQAGPLAMDLLRHGRPAEDENILVNGALGSTGSFVLALAKAAGNRVVAVDHKQKTHLASSWGAARSINYQEDDYLKCGETYDRIIDLVGTKSPLENARLLNSKGQYLLVGGSLKKILATSLVGGALKFGGTKQVKLFVHQPRPGDLEHIADLCLRGTLAPRIGLQAALVDAAQAVGLLESGSIAGKLVILP